MKDVLEQDLRKALERHRPDPEAFRLAVERKIAEREAADNSRIEVKSSAWPEARSGALRRAASFLPLGIFDPASVGAHAVLGKPAGLPGLTALLALPAVSLAMFALTFVGALRSLAGLRSNSSASHQVADQAVRDWWSHHTSHALLVVIVLLVVGWTQPLEAVALVILVSMVVLASTLAKLARVGAASRESVGKFTANLLGALTLLTVFVGGLGPGLGDPRFRQPGVPLALIAGLFACDVLGNWKQRRTWLKRALSVGLPVLILGAGALRIHAARQPLDRERLTRFVEEFDEPLDDVVNWMRFGVVAEWLRLDGSERLEAPGARRRLGEALADLDEGESLLNSKSPPHSLLGAARADVLPESAWESLLADGERFDLLAHDGRLLESATTEWLLRAVTRQPLESEERDRLAARLIAAWPAPEKSRALESMAFYQDMLELLERPHAAASLAPAVQRALVFHMEADARLEADAAGFVSNVEALSDDKPDIHLVEPTRAAVRLMRRFGIPDGVDLDHVENFLVRAATPSVIEALSPEMFDLLTVQEYHFVAEVALRELHALRSEAARPGPTPSAWQRLMDARLVLGALALVGLCLFATWRASPSLSGLGAK